MMLHGVDVEAFVALFKRQREQLYLKHGVAYPIAPLSRWADAWMRETWPDKMHEERLKCWHELLGYVKEQTS